MALCGPKLSICCLFLSVWGVIQLAIMGICFYYQSVGLAEDLHLQNDYVKQSNLTVEEFYDDVYKANMRAANNCWIAAGMYVVTFIVSAHQLYASTRLQEVQC